LPPRQNPHFSPFPQEIWQKRGKRSPKNPKSDPNPLSSFLNFFAPFFGMGTSSPPSNL